MINHSNVQANAKPHSKLGIASLSAVPQTLMIPLAARAKGPDLFPALGFLDPAAVRVWDQIRQQEPVDEFEYLSSRLNVYSLMRRTQVFRTLGEGFFSRFPRALGLCFGCGLSDYFQWLDRGTNRFIDSDLPEVIEVRKRLMLPRNERHSFVGASLTEQTESLSRSGFDKESPSNKEGASLGWWSQLGLSKAEPTFVMIEGVLMYLQPNEVRRVFQEFGDYAAPGSELIFDFSFWLAVGRARDHHPVLKRTGAEFHWGVRKVSEFSQMHPRLEVKQVHRVMQGYQSMLTLAESVFSQAAGTPFYGVAQMGVR